MKQYTTPEQTAKLIELGAEKPRCLHNCVLAYNVGELIEMLPEVICLSNDDSIHYYLEVYNNALYWNVAYKDGDYEAYHVDADELIDALYYTIVRLKEEGTI